MADFIQSKIELFHTFDTKEPTKSENETQPKDDVNEVGENKKKGLFEQRGIERKLGRTAVYRRLVNLAAQTVEQTTTRIYDDKIFRASLAGDRRTMIKNQQEQSQARGNINAVKGLVGAGITTIALSNPYILGIYLSSQVFTAAQTMSSQQQQLEHYNILRDKEIFETRRRQNRLIIGTFNRRG